MSIRGGGTQPLQAFWIDRFIAFLDEGTSYYGRILKNLEEVRAAAIAFRDRYNRDWRLEMGFKSPLEARRERLLK
nr:hypothetical protein [Paraburkholderia sp. BL8N3]